MVFTRGKRSAYDLRRAPLDLPYRFVSFFLKIGRKLPKRFRLSLVVELGKPDYCAVMPDEIQTLRVVNRLFPLILSGEKTSTIRWRKVPISLGPMRYICEGALSKTVIVNVTQCTEMPLSQAAKFLGKEKQWPDDVMLHGMREHYPDIKLSDVVQVVEHRPPI